MKSYLIEHHAHYTGSLPLEFIWLQLKGRNLDFEKYQLIWNRLLPRVSCQKWMSLSQEAKDHYFVDLSQSLRNVFSKDWQINLDTFNKIYGFFQFVTKSNEEQESRKLYHQGAYAIAKSYYTDGVDYFELKSGPGSTIDETIWRLESMNSGFEQFEKEVGLKQFCLITLTFIRKNEIFVNFSWELLEELFEILDQPIGQRINGFDFSGDETKKGVESQLKIIDEIEKFNSRRRLKGKKELIITVHVGENFKGLDAGSHLTNLTKLSKKRINRLGHGTFLWIQPCLIGLGKEEIKEREHLLKYFVTKQVEFEICPTSNALLTPLGSTKLIPIKEMEKQGVRLSINTDNKTIFSTNLRKENLLVSIAL